MSLSRGDIYVRDIPSSSVHLNSTVKRYVMKTPECVYLTLCLGKSVDQPIHSSSQGCSFFWPASNLILDYTVSLARGRPIKTFRMWSKLYPAFLNPLSFTRLFRLPTNFTMRKPSLCVGMQDTIFSCGAVTETPPPTRGRTTFRRYVHIVKFCTNSSFQRYISFTAWIASCRTRNDAAEEPLSRPGAVNFLRPSAEWTCVKCAAHSSSLRNIIIIPRPKVSHSLVSPFPTTEMLNHISSCFLWSSSRVVSGWSHFREPFIFCFSIPWNLAGLSILSAVHVIEIPFWRLSLISACLFETISHSWLLDCTIIGKLLIVSIKHRYDLKRACAARNYFLIIKVPASVIVGCCNKPRRSHNRCGSSHMASKLLNGALHLFFLGTIMLNINRMGIRCWTLTKKLNLVQFWEQVIGEPSPGFCVNLNSVIITIAFLNDTG